MSYIEDIFNTNSKSIRFKVFSEIGIDGLIAEMSNFQLFNVYNAICGKSGRVPCYQIGDPNIEEVIRFKYDVLSVNQIEELVPDSLVEKFLKEKREKQKKVRLKKFDIRNPVMCRCEISPFFGDISAGGDLLDSFAGLFKQASNQKEEKMKNQFKLNEVEMPDCRKPVLMMVSNYSLEQQSVNRIYLYSTKDAHFCVHENDESVYLCGAQRFREVGWKNIKAIPKTKIVPWQHEEAFIASSKGAVFKSENGFKKPYIVDHWSSARCIENWLVCKNPDLTMSMKLWKFVPMTKEVEI